MLESKLLVVSALLVAVTLNCAGEGTLAAGGI